MERFFADAQNDKKDRKYVQNDKKGRKYVQNDKKDRKAQNNKSVQNDKSAL